MNPAFHTAQRRLALRLLTVAALSATLGACAPLIVGGAILLWALLALFTIGSAPVPALLLNAICFGIGGLIGLVISLPLMLLPFLLIRRKKS